MSAIETKTIGKYLIEIHADENPESPRNWDNLGTMVCFHKRYDLGDNHDYRASDYDNWEDMAKAISRNEDVAVILPLYLYDHSGITISTGSFNCRWDSGQIGFIFISKDKVRKEYNVKRINKALIERVTKYLEGEVETYDQYLRGDVYGFKVFEIEECNLGCEHKEEIDSCWGFYGQETAMEEAESVVKYSIENDEKEQKKEQEQTA